MLILGIDTSFDDTAAAVVRDTIILSNVLSTELGVHQEFGGVVPRLAREAHQNQIDAVIDQAMKRAHVSWDEIEAIAVTRGPGLAITLEVGITKAKELSILHNKPIIPVNHMEGHLLSFLAKGKKKSPNSNPVANGQILKNNASLSSHFPLIGILISGGHTQFVYAKEIGEYEIVGETQDDAMGECFDKVGRMLGLGYPAGRLVEDLAKEGMTGKVVFPIPMRQVKSADTSYSGLKTAALRIVETMQEQNNATLSRQQIADVALGFQTAAITHLLEKLDFALDRVGASKEVRALALGGGVVCNGTVRKRMRSFAKVHHLPLFVPYSKKLFTDNAAMIALVAQWKNSSDLDGLDRLPTWSLERES